MKNKEQGIKKAIDKPKARISEYFSEINGSYWIVEYKTWFGWTQPKDMYGLNDGSFWDKKEAMKWFKYYCGDRKDKLVSVKEK